MEEKNHPNFFFIERLDMEEKSQSLSEIYDLSILNESKEKKQNTNCLEKIEKKDENDFNKKAQFFKVIKKVILSTNLYFRWKAENIKKSLFSSHMYSLISLLILIIIKNNSSTKTEIKSEEYINYSNISLGNISSPNFSLNNETDTYSAIFNALSDKKKLSILEIIHLFFMNNIGLIPAWILFIWKLKPKWEKINNITYKFTNYLLLCESNQNEKYSYCLASNYSIIIEKKNTFKINNNYIKNRYLENLYPPEKNIFLYIISVIYDYDFKALSSVNYYKLLSNEDLGYIMILLKFMKNNFEDKMIELLKKILSPSLLACLINFFYFNNFDLFSIFLINFIFVVFFISYFIFMDKYNIYLTKVDSFINIYNKVLIKNNKFFYRKDNLILFFTLKNNIYTEEQIIYEINKIINS